MSGVRSGALVVAGRLMRYPGPDYQDDLRAFAELAAQLHVPASRDLQSFSDDAGGRSVNDLQELFTQTFDFTPECALDVGWHLFGEEYERGAFLADMRQRLREHGIPEGAELPDHLASLLLLLTRVDREQAVELTANAVGPAVDKLVDNLQKAQSPFAPLMATLRHVLAAGLPAAPPREVQHV